MKKSLQRIRAVMHKETIQLGRDWHTLFMMLAIPVIELLLLAYASSFTITDLPMAVFDQSHDDQSRAFVERLTNSDYFELTAIASSRQELIDLMDAGKAKAGLLIPPNLNEEISQGEGNVLLLLDGSDSFSLQSAYSAANSISQEFALDLTMENIEQSAMAQNNAMPVFTSVQTLYNPVRDDLIFIVPAVAVVILQMFAIIGIAMTIVREREWGIAEQLLSTPIRPLENIIGKIFPYLGLAFFEAIIIHLIGALWFHVPFNGSIILYLSLVILFLVSSLTLGLFISTIASTQKQVQLVSSLILVLTFLLTGLVYSRIPMPYWTQMVGNLLPATHFIPIARGVIVKGVGVNAFWRNILALGVFIVVLFFSFPILTKKRMD